jgi:hypothetical protein
MRFFDTDLITVMAMPDLNRLRRIPTITRDIFGYASGGLANLQTFRMPSVMTGIMEKSGPRRPTPLCRSVGSSVEIRQKPQ